ncbi:hypothetical protein [[Enterobacter] lignolyticus]
MNRLFSLNQSRRSGVHLSPITCISAIQICRSYTHLGATQDSRAGTAL